MIYTYILHMFSCEWTKAKATSANAWAAWTSSQSVRCWTPRSKAGLLLGWLKKQENGAFEPSQAAFHELLCDLFFRNLILSLVQNSSIHLQSSWIWIPNIINFNCLIVFPSEDGPGLIYHVLFVESQAYGPSKIIRRCLDDSRSGWVSMRHPKYVL